MFHISEFSHKLHLHFIFATAVAFFAAVLVSPGFSGVVSSGNNFYTVSLNGEEAGTAASDEDAENALAEARRRIASESDELICIRTDLDTEGKEVLFGKVNSTGELADRMEEILRNSEDSGLRRCYTLKIGENMVTLESREDILELLTEALRQYDTESEYVVNLVPDSDREINVFTSQVLSSREQQINEEKETQLPTSGIAEKLSDVLDNAQPAVGKSLSDYKLGLVSIDFEESIEVAESYMPGNQISTLEEAEETVLGRSSKNQIHEVVSGDTLSQIAQDNSMTLDELLGLNPNYASADAVIRVGDLITVTSPSPALSVKYEKQEYFEQEYEADIIYQDNDEWYTNESEVIQQPSSGFRKYVALVDYVDGTEQSSTVLQQDVVATAVPKIIERGTKAIPTYIWPVSGGYISSGFGGRKAPKAGASTYHQGLDIAVSTGTAVMASCGGTVSQAGWQSGYGYVVYINHPDGKQTRYGHLSKILVKSGQTVSQGQKIALSGNTGNSTGPHLHFEIRVNGTAVNPLTYLQ